ncbi:FecCD family ABC transporter permease [Nocardioides sp. Bht2]|uniref:FecCD family ABC transporter permease n=1 Tax=Nocardioides sp. Bht2 TaxID=3392297 RepID=UPI0039B496DC
MAERARTPLVLTLALLALLVAVLVSLSFGSSQLPLSRVWTLLLSGDDSLDSDILRNERLPRTLLAIVVGIGLALGGLLMQTLTRNPLADPGILGVNAGASFAVVLGVALFGVVSIWGYVWFALLGAALAAVVVHLIGASGGPGMATRVVLAGVAVSAVLTSFTQGVVLADREAFNEFRFWVAGSLEGRGWPVLACVSAFIAVGVVLARIAAPGLDALALGEETGRGLGVDVRRTRALGMVAITVLCGAATAAVGPILFVGLAVPFAARALVGHDQRRLIALCALLGPIWMLSADVLARLIVPGQEIQTGVVAALAGAPVFVALVRRRRIPAL